ncbi:uncharacterized protein LOC6543895 [Drosophila erecta]|uniref:Uncharacterized protein n=1 Tax=Drosophila erecta TaxID=7220 RepID=B3NEA8_DROER|nr:uncharacterized protein LOC6543895 [Drosophila erecta]EDV52672.1 uncharacterized protein Dere_GG16200 [Drosophila erecta]
MLKFVCLLPIITIAILKITQAQRPSFAGLRPPGGLSQKDKYFQTKNTAVENFNGGTGSIDPNFSQKKIINLPYGAPQRPPIGVPLVYPSTPHKFSTSPSPVGFPTSTAPDDSRLPIDARGDREWVNRLRQLPLDQQPFWLLNYQAIEALRNSSRPNVG